MSGYTNELVKSKPDMTFNELKPACNIREPNHLAPLQMGQINENDETNNELEKLL